MTEKYQREMKIDQSILNLKKRHIFNDFQKHRGNSKHKVCLIMRRGTTNE